jgi:hypothetical protein
MLGTCYHIEPVDKRVQYEIITDQQRLALISLWKHNRPPDPARVEEIKTHLKHTHMCDGQILLAIVDGKCVCYDGAHRLFACRQYFPKGGVQVRIIYDCTHSDVRKEFERVNRSVPVPELYFSEDDVSKRLISLSHGVAKDLCEIYKPYVSTSRRPKRPNFNRDIFSEQLCEIIKQVLSNETIHGLTEEMIGKWLTDINNQIRTEHYSGKTRIKASSKIISKCEVNNLFIFAVDWRKMFIDKISTL